MRVVVALWIDLVRGLKILINLGSKTIKLHLNSVLKIGRLLVALVLP